MSNEQLFDGRGISPSEASVPGGFEEWCGQTELSHRELGREKEVISGQEEGKPQLTGRLGEGTAVRLVCTWGPLPGRS